MRHSHRMDEIVRRISSHPTQLLEDAEVQLSLSNMEEITTQNKLVTHNGENYVQYLFIVTFLKINQDVSTYSSFLPTK